MEDGPHGRRRLVGSAWRQRQVAPPEVAPAAVDVSDCILLFGAFCNGEKQLEMTRGADALCST